MNDKQIYTNLNIAFEMGGIRFTCLTLAYEKFFRSIPNHVHSMDGYEIHYISEGCGIATIDSKAYELKANDLYMTGPGVSHSQVPNRLDPMTEYCIYLSARPDTRKSSKSNKSDTFMKKFSDIHFWFGCDNENMLTLMKTLFNELESHRPGYRTVIETLLMQAVIKMVRNYEDSDGITSEQTADPGNTKSQYVTIDDSFLYEYTDITLEKLAERLSLSTRQTERLLMQHYGQTFLQKKTEAKMSAASLMLTDTSASITEISSRLGYSSIEHFSNTFRRFYGMSAREYRKKLKAT